ncbi:MAG TPA: hypothetical protein VIM58_02980, partial [Candidatus Methylacidiphilales bacterium]
MVLVVVLGILAIVSALALSFFSRAAVNRQTSFASAGQERANIVASTALATILGDLQEEIRAGSTEVPGTAGTPVYLPLTNLNMLPQGLGNTGLTNLVKESVGGSNLWSGSRYRFAGPIRSYAGDCSTNASANGRTLPPSRWQAPRLLSSAENALLRPPDWVPVTRGGPLTNAPSVPFSSLTNAAPGNANFVVGRYAYTVYNTGGLLDANVAGYSSKMPLTATDLARKGSEAALPLVGIGGLTQEQIDALVQWRTPGTVTNYASYLAQLGQTNGYLTPAPGNQAFLSRQDLIRYATTNGLAQALPYLTTFSREKNSPSWSPRTPAGSTIDYAGQAEAAASANRDLANARASDGSSLIKNRFDLDRFAWLTWEGPSATLSSSDPLYNANGTAANIRKYFGLVWDSSAYNQTTERGQQWIYTSPDGTGTAPAAIKTLAQVAAQGREPDFFELMKAAILTGSLGLASDGEIKAGTNPIGASGLGSDLNALNYR